MRIVSVLILLSLVVVPVHVVAGEKLTGVQIKEVLENNTIYSVNPKWKFKEAEYFQSDGIVKFKDWDDKNMNELGSAKWYINEMEQLCKESLTDTSKGPRCFSIESGKKKDQIVMKLESGKKSRSYPKGIYNKTLIQGNKYDL